MANFNKQQTALDIIQQVCGQLGLPSPTAAASNPNDKTATQMLAQLNFSGRRLIKPIDGFRWQVLKRTWELVTVPGQTRYPMPEDWDSFEDLTGWNFTSRLPMLGPASDPQWQTLKARNLGSSTISVIYRSRNNEFEIYNTFPDPQQLRIDYASRGWVRATGAEPYTYKDSVTSDDDLILYDPELMVAATKLRFLTSKGFDTASSMSEFNLALEAAMNADIDAPILSVNVNDTYPLISTQFNAPDTGYGI